MLGAAADTRNIGSAPLFLIAGIVCIVIHLLFVILGARLFRVDVSMAAIASVASVGGAASAPVAAGFHREELVPISIMLALIGYALGNYLGVATALLCPVRSAAPFPRFRSCRKTILSDSRVISARGP